MNASDNKKASGRNISYQSQTSPNHTLWKVWPTAMQKAGESRDTKPPYATFVTVCPVLARDEQKNATWYWLSTNVSIDSYPQTVCPLFPILLFYPFSG